MKEFLKEVAEGANDLVRVCLSTRASLRCDVELISYVGD